MSHSTETLHLRQRQMMAALLGENDQIAAHIVGDQNLNAEQRLSIYKSGYKIRLGEVIDNDHPILGSYLGDDLFDQMVEGFIASTPSRFRSLRHYCDPLPDYLHNDPFFSQYPHLAELARFERYLLSSFDASDSEIATQATLHQLPPEQWPQMQLRFHPSLQLFISDYNAVEIWRAIKAEQTPPNPVQQPVCWVLWRNQERLTEFRSIENLELNLLNLFLQGHDFTTAAEQAAVEVGEQAAAGELLNILLRWLELGYIQQLTGSDSTPDLTLV